MVKGGMLLIELISIWRQKETLTMEAQFTDKSLKCSDCGAGFEFTTGEQEFYKARGLMNEPKRCPSCRSQKKNRGVMAERKLFDVVCDQCGVQTQVPFMPRQSRPVLCRECFDKMRVAV